MIITKNNNNLKSLFIQEITEKINNLTWESFDSSCLLLGEKPSPALFEKIDLRIKNYFKNDKYFLKAKELYKKLIKNEEDLPNFLKSKKDFIKNSEFILSYLISILDFNLDDFNSFDNHNQLIIRQNKLIEIGNAYNCGSLLDKDSLTSFINLLDESLLGSAGLDFFTTKIFYDMNSKSFQFVDLDNYSSDNYYGCFIHNFNFCAYKVCIEKFDTVYSVSTDLEQLAQIEDGDIFLIFLKKKIIEWFTVIENLCLTGDNDHLGFSTAIQLGVPIFFLSDRKLSYFVEEFNFDRLKELKGKISKEEILFLKELIIKSINNLFDL